MPDTTIFLVRHGMHDWLRPDTNRFAGTLPGIGLNAQGRQESEQLHDVLLTVPLEWAASSPLQRTMETAQLIIGDRDIPLVHEERLIEWRCRPWEGMDVKEIQARYPEEWRVWHRNPTQLILPETEPLTAVANRVEAAFHEWAARGGYGLLVSHQDPLAALLSRLIGMPLEHIRSLVLPTGSLSRCRVTSYGVVVDEINAVAALP